jgi:hypothetical protein
MPMIMTFMATRNFRSSHKRLQHIESFQRRLLLCDTSLCSSRRQERTGDIELVLEQPIGIYDCFTTVCNKTLYCGLVRAVYD